jgi:hypothetical protein
MKTFRIICAAPLFAIGMAFTGIAALILGDHHVDWLDEPTQHH